MKCVLCSANKLSNEFPAARLTAGCRHPRTCCMRCVIAQVKKKSTCPFPDCGQPLSPTSKMIAVLQRTLDEMFREYSTTYTQPYVAEEASQGMLRIAVLNGDSTSLPFSPSMTVMHMKELIKIRLKHDVQKQKLLYNDKEMKVYGDGGKQMQLSDYNIQPNSTVYLVVLMFAIPKGFDHVVFDLHWGYPAKGRDYLDASCLMFSGQNFVDLADYGRIYVGNTSVQHSGDVMDDLNRIGHHTIHVYMKKLPSTVTHLFFTLSAWNSPNISRYPNPSLKFYEANKPGTDLCKTTFTHANHSQAVIMCSVSRSAAGWAIYESGKLSAGNAKRYDPIKSTIRTLIAQGF